MSYGCDNLLSRMVVNDDLGTSGRHSRKSRPILWDSAYVLKELRKYTVRTDKGPSECRTDILTTTARHRLIRELRILVRFLKLVIQTL